MSNDSQDNRTASLVKAGFAAGIGSAAIVAAVLYASKSRTKKPKKAKPAPHATD